MRALAIQTSKEWGYIPVYGMQTTGQPEADSWRPIGVAHHSVWGFIISEQELASGMEQLALITAAPRSQQTGGLLPYTSNWVMPKLATWNGSEKISWPMTTALITKDTTDRSLPNALDHNSKHFPIATITIYLLFVTALVIFILVLNPIILSYLWKNKFPLTQKLWKRFSIYQHYSNK